jgi:prepilin-type N-terminal cleavage/methylation domain-containing protein
MIEANNKSGFTLIELLTVMAIIAILAGMSLFALSGARQNARDTKRKSDLESIRSAVELFKADCGFYPGSLSYGNPLTGSTCTPSNANIYIQTVPQDSITGRSYSYNSSSTTYTLCAALEDGSTPVGGCTSGCGSASCNYKVTNP